MAWSIVNFSAEEIVNLAVEIEKQGKKFYEMAASKVDKPEVKEMYQYLAGEEDQHIKDFDSLGQNLPGDFKPNEKYIGEYGDYIKALIDNHVFNYNNVENFAAAAGDAAESLTVAFRFEKDSILIFQELYNVVEDKGKEIIGELIEQEKQHIQKLKEIYEKIN